MPLDPAGARAQLQLLRDAKTHDERDELSAALINFLLPQQEELRVLAAGWMRPGGAESISGAVWSDGKELAEISDELTALVSAAGLPRHEEFASRLALAFAFPVVGHYPNEIFPRMVRNAIAKEKLGQIDEALGNYDGVLSDFVSMETPHIWDYDPLHDTSRTILEAALAAAEGTLRLKPDAGADVKELRDKIAAKLRAHPTTAG